MVFKCGIHTVDLSLRTHIMGILNITPDSFSDGGKYFSTDMAVEHAVQMLSDGADIIDIGGESSRPGASKISTDDELERVIPVIRAVSKITNNPISIDTYKPEVAEAAIKEGAAIVNDITALGDLRMVEVIAKNNAGVVLMHMKGTPENMQKNPSYNDAVGEIKSYLRNKAENAIKNGIARERIVIDPGIGFGKTLSHNLSILKNLSEFKTLGFPILIGTSKKSFIGQIMNLPPDDRLEGTAATVCISILNGANIVRVHDVKTIKRTAAMVDRVQRQT